MKNKFTILLVGGLFILIFRQSSAQIGKIVASFPSPGKKPTGLAWDGRYLWNADTDTKTFYQIDPVSGATVYAVPNPSGATVNGLTWDGTFLWCSDNENNRLYKINIADSSIVHVIYLQTTAPRGMAFDGQYIWYQDSGQQRIFKLDPTTYTFVDTLTSPGGYNRGLTYDGTYLWSTDRYKNEFYEIDPDRGSIITILSAPGSYSYGLAFDGEFLWNADYETDTIYKISIRGSEKYQISDPLQVKIRYSLKVKNVGSSTMNLKTFLACPKGTVYQLLDDSLQFLNPPQSFFADKYGQQLAYYEESVSPGQEKLYQWSLRTTLYNIRYFIHPDSVGTLTEVPQSISDMYTADGDKYKISHPAIITAVQQAIGGETNLYWQVRKIHDYIIAHIEYLNDNSWGDAPTILSQGHGSCSEYSFLFIAMCRAAGIPARFEAGGHLRDEIPYEDRVFHRWQQVYFPHYGWVPIDCTWDDKSYPCNQARYFGAMSNKTFTTTIGGGGEYGLWWTYNAANSSSGGKREREKVMEWLPYTTAVDLAVELITDSPKICYNYPNPFNSQTIIQYHLSFPSQVTICIFNQLGQLVRSWDEGVVFTGWHQRIWDGRNDYGLPVSSGIYFYRIENTVDFQNGRMSLIR